MPMDKSLYPKNWDEIARAVKNEADWRCEQCNRRCKRWDEDWAMFAGAGWLSGELDGKYGRFILTVAHLDHIPQNCDRANLKALCAPCHCRYDLKAMAQKKRLKAERQGQLTIFAEVEVLHG